MRIPGIRYVQGRNSYSDADGTKTGIAIHNTANTASAEAEASYATRRGDGVSAHFYVDDEQVIQSLDTKARAGHAGSSNGNQNAIAVEITGTNTRSRQWWLDNVAWDQLGRVLAACCREYGIAVRRASVAEMGRNPKVKAFYGHDDMRRAWGGTTHTDPGENFPWDRLFDAVSAALNGEDDDDMFEAEDRNRTIADTYRLDGALGMKPEVTYTITRDGKAETRREPNRLAATLLEIKANLSTLAGKDFVDEQAIANAVLAGLAAKPVDEIKAALRAALPAETYAALFPQG